MIKAGDVVILKIGGPKMTVSEVRDGEADCVWFVQRTEGEHNFRDYWEGPKYGTFALDTLTLD